MKKFNIIAAISKNYVIGNKNKIPWHYKEDFKYFKRITSQSKNGKKNIVIMGMNTFKSIGKPLPNRINFVVDRNVICINKKNDNLYHINDIYFRNDHQLDQFNNLMTKLVQTKSAPEYNFKLDYNDIYIIGGQKIYDQIIKADSKYLDKVYLTKINKEVEGDTFFPKLYNDFDLISCNEGENKDLSFCVYQKRNFLQKQGFNQMVHPEYQYLNIIKSILDTDEIYNDRTGTGIKSIFGTQTHFDISRHIPLLTTKRMFTRGIIEELLWLLRGDTDNKKLQEKGVHIWDGNTDRKFLDKMGFTEREEGDGGPIYGFQFRHSGAEYKDCHTDYTGQGIDQVQNVIKLIREKPESRRIIINLWNVCDLDQMVLPPCHVLYQFRVYGDRLCCSMYQRSGDVGLGVPFNIVSASIMTHIFAKLTGKKPWKLVHTIGDAHIYVDHIKPLERQLKRKPFSFPLFEIKDRGQKEVEDFEYDDFIIKGYEHHKGILMKMAV
jgi:thymidylate synthase